MGQNLIILRILIVQSKEEVVLSRLTQLKLKVTIHNNMVNNIHGSTLDTEVSVAQAQGGEDGDKETPAVAPEDIMAR